MPFNILGNIIWLIFGGLFTALGYLFGGIVLCCTIIGIPFGLQCFKLAGIVLFPFGKEVISRSSNGGCLTTLFNLIWIVCGGFWVALSHLVFGIILYISIIGIPFGRQHFKLIELSMMPFGKEIR